MKNSLTINDFLKEAGRTNFEKSCGKKPQLVTRAISDGKFPPSWYINVRIFCVANKLDCPHHLFKWDNEGVQIVNTKQFANFLNDFQVAEK